MDMSNPFIKLIIIICVLIGAWWIVEYFSPHPLVTKLCQLAIFVIALVVLVKLLLPAMGVSF